MASINVTIAAGIDDVEYDSANDVYTTSGTSVKCGYTTFMGPFNQHIGLRFPSVNVPKDTVVTTATITVEVIGHVGTPDFIIRGNDVDDAPAWPATNTVGNRPSDMGAETTASVSPTVSGTGNISFDVSGIVNEIFARASWAANNDLRVHLENNAVSGAHNFTIETQETGAPTYGPAQLDITFPGGDYEMPKVEFHSWYPVDSPDTLPHIYVGAGANSKHEEGLAVAGSIASDVTWRGRAMMPPTLPSGTAKLLMVALANATSGTIAINPKWASVKVVSTADLTATMKWTASGSGTNEYYMELSGGGDPSATHPCAVYDDGASLKGGVALGSLTAGSWGWGDNDTLGYSTIYARLSDGADPDTSTLMSADEPGEEPAAASLNAEGSTYLTWNNVSPDTADIYVGAKIPMNADTIVAGEMVVLDVVFEAAGSDLAVLSNHRFWVIWEA